MKQWYVVQFSGYNNNNIIHIAQKLRKLLGDEDVFCPIIKERRYNGKKRIFYDIDTPLFFGYIFIRTEYDRALEARIEDQVAPRYQFLKFGENEKWALVTDDEIEEIKREHSGLINQDEILDSTLSAGDVVRFRSGSFANFTGKIVSVSSNRNTAKVMTEVFHNDTVVECALNSLEPVI